MARNFASASSQYLSTASSPASGTPMTIACWVRPANSNTTIAAVSVGQAAAAHRNQVFVQGNTIFIAANGASGLAQALSTNSTAFNNTWVHACGVFTSATSRTVYRDGGSSATNTENCGSQNTADSIAIGARSNGSFGLFFNGDIADVGVWNVALNADEIASLADGMTCDKVRPQSLKYYAPLVRELIDLKGLTLTNSGATTVVAHTRVYS